MPFGHIQIVGSEREVCKALDLEAIRTDRQNQYAPYPKTFADGEERILDEKVGECRVLDIWVAGIWARSPNPKGCLVYAQADRAHRRDEQIPNCWQRMAFVWKDTQAKKLQYGKPIDVTTDPLLDFYRELNLADTDKTNKSDDHFFLYRANAELDLSLELVFSRGSVAYLSFDETVRTLLHALAQYDPVTQHYLDLWQGSEV